jgi:hypothetical protein
LLYLPRWHSQHRNHFGSCSDFEIVKAAAEAI